MSDKQRKLDLRYLRMARIWAENSYCQRRQVGALVVKVTSSPWFYIALTTMLIGTQLFLAGFLGDLISRSSSNRNDYQIEKTI